jgi:hypothetical protein
MSSIHYSPTFYFSNGSGSRSNTFLLDLNIKREQAYKINYLLMYNRYIERSTVFLVRAVRSHVSRVSRTAVSPLQSTRAPVT